MAWIGSLVLIGIVVNNGIVLVDHINNLRRKGMSRPDAIREGCRERLRPIVMTAATTVVGLIPLAFGDQGFFDMRYFPMARTVMGGLIASTVLTLIVLPTYYSLMDDFLDLVPADLAKQRRLRSAAAGGFERSRGLSWEPPGSSLAGDSYAILTS